MKTQRSTVMSCALQDHSATVMAARPTMLQLPFQETGWIQTRYVRFVSRSFVVLGKENKKRNAHHTVLDTLVARTLAPGLRVIFHSLTSCLGSPNPPPFPAPSSS